jgi:hypothetical protein
MRYRDEDAYVERFRALAAVNTPLAHRILLVRNIMEQRNITGLDIQRVTGYGKRWILQALAFIDVRIDNDSTEGKKLKWESVHERLDVIEHAITLETQARGGVYASTGATKEYADDFQDMISSARVSLEQGLEEA